MITKVELEKKLMTNLRELTDVEQEELKIVAAIFMKHCEDYTKAKIEDYKKSIEEQIVFYGRKKQEYDTNINQLIEKYESLINKIITEYNTRFVSIINEIQDTSANQKIAIVNMKVSVDINSNIKWSAAEGKKNNYEIVLQECFRQIEDCWNELETKLNEIFYSKSNQLMVKKNNIFQKLINIFTGKKNVSKFVFEPLETEISQLDNKITGELPKINEETINNIAIIKSAQIQTQEIFNEMIEG